MRKYIDAETVDNLLGNAYQERMILTLQPENKRQGDIATGINYSRNKIHDLPPADVQEVKHGKWIFIEEKLLQKYMQCSVCNHVTSDYIIERIPNEDADDSFACVDPYFCPKCGARMDGEANE